MLNKNQFFSPQSLKKERIYHANFLLEIPEQEKAKVEFSSLHFVQEFPLVELLKTPENRYWLYQNSPFSTDNSYSFRLKFYDQQTKSFSFSSLKREHLSSSSAKQIFSLKNEFNLRKGRVLSAYSKGWKYMINGSLKKVHFKKKKIYLKRTKKYKKRSRVKVLSRKRRLFFSIPSYGLITNIKPMSKLFLRWKKLKRKKKLCNFIKYPSSFQKILKVTPFNFLKKKKKGVLKKLISKKT